MDKILASKERYLRDINRLDCRVLVRNCKNFAETYLYDVIAPSTFKAFDAGVFQSVFDQKFDNRVSCLDLYSGQAEVLQKTFQFSALEAVELSDSLESIAVLYLGLKQSDLSRMSLKEMHSDIKKFVEKLTYLSKGIDTDYDSFAGILTSISNDASQSKFYADATKAIVQAQKNLETLPDFVINSPIFKASEIGKRVPRGNPALQVWVEEIYRLWTERFNRTVQNNNDAKNGRKYLLELLEFSIAPLHEAIEFETLNNMLLKVQIDVKKRGGFSHPDFELGNSSPFRAARRNQESST